VQADAAQQAPPLRKQSQAVGERGAVHHHRCCRDDPALHGRDDARVALLGDAKVVRGHDELNAVHLYGALGTL
jgi:hypothetical protein